MFFLEQYHLLNQFLIFETFCIRFIRLYVNIAINIANLEPNKKNYFIDIINIKWYESFGKSEEENFLLPSNMHCVKSVRISYSCPHFPSFRLNTGRCGISVRIPPYSVRMRRNEDQNNSQHGHFTQWFFVKRLKLYFFCVPKLS